MHRPHTSLPQLKHLLPWTHTHTLQQHNRALTHARPLRATQYEEGSAPYLALQATRERTTNRFANYAKAGLLCGNDGLPHLISDPGLALRFNHAGEVFVSV